MKRWFVFAALAAAGLATVVLAVLPSCSTPTAPAVPSTAALRILLVRHAQSENNAAAWRKLFLGIRDPALTQLGREQARRASRALQGELPDLVFSSSLLRAQQTATLAFPNATVHVAPHVSELGIGGCAVSPGACPRPRAEQAAQLAPSQADWAMVGDEPLGPPSWEAFRGWLVRQPAVQQLVAAKGAAAKVALVSHGNFLQFKVLPCGFGHPHNVQAYAARLPLRGSARVEGVVGVWQGG